MICHSGLENNRSKPVKKKPLCSSGQGSRPGELSSSPPVKMPASDGTLGELKSPSFRSNASTCITLKIRDGQLAAFHFLIFFNRN